MEYVSANQSFEVNFHQIKSDLRSSQVVLSKKNKFQSLKDNCSVIEKEQPKYTQNSKRPENGRIIRVNKDIVRDEILAKRKELIKNRIQSKYVNTPLNKITINNHTKTDGQRNEIPIEQNSKPSLNVSDKSIIYSKEVQLALAKFMKQNKNLTTNQSSKTSIIGSNQQELYVENSSVNDSIKNLSEEELKRAHGLSNSSDLHTKITSGLNSQIQTQRYVASNTEINSNVQNIITKTGGSIDDNIPIGYFSSQVNDKNSPFLPLDSSNLLKID